MAITPIPVVTFQSSIQPVNPPPQTNAASQNNQANQNQVQDLQQLPVNQIPTQAPGLFGLALALENLDQRNQNLLNANLPKAPQNPERGQQTQNSHAQNAQKAQNPSPAPGSPQQTQPGPGATLQSPALGQFSPQDQAAPQPQGSTANATPQQQAGTVLNLFA